MVDGVIGALEKKRILLGLSATAMAAHIGVRRMHYHRLLKGYPPGKKVLGGILLAFPDLQKEVLAEILASARNRLEAK